MDRILLNIAYLFLLGVAVGILYWRKRCKKSKSKTPISSADNELDSKARHNEALEFRKKQKRDSF